MNRRARQVLVLCVIALGAIGVARGQIVHQPTPPPVATAENEPWYLSGEPIADDGLIYYQAGPRVHFNANEMVRSGVYRGIPLYVRTTLEPFSVVFVPLPGGMMQPYERRRAGEIAGTAGSMASPLPLEIAAEDRTRTRSGALVLQAPAPPTNVGPYVVLPEPERAIVAPAIAAPSTDAGLQPGAPSARETVGTSGRAFAAPTARLVPAGERPSGVNAVFIQFRNSRWYTTGGAVPFDASHLEQIDDYRGFPVYIRPGHEEVIYIPATSDVRGLVVPYSTRRTR